MDDDDEDIFQKNIISRYILRPTKLEHLCLASFAANYTVSKWNDDDEETGHVSNILTRTMITLIQKICLKK